MFQLGDRFPLTKATSCVRLIPIKLRALVLVQIGRRSCAQISAPILARDLGYLRSAEYKYGRGPAIFGVEEPADYLYQVIEGAVRSYKLLSDGRRQIGAFHLAGDIFGLERRKSHVSVGTQDLTRTRVAAFHLEMDRRLTPAGIIALPMNRRDIADYLGLTLETVSRALSDLKKRGFLKFLGQTQRDCSSESRWPRRTGSKAAAELESTVHSPNGH